MYENYHYATYPEPSYPPPRSLVITNATFDIPAEIPSDVQRRGPIILRSQKQTRILDPVGLTPVAARYIPSAQEARHFHSP